MVTQTLASLQIALLLHEAARQSHVDLLIAAAPGAVGDDERTVRAWRCPTRPDEAATTLELTRIDDHRGLYLRLEGPRDLGRERGVVQPLRRGVANQRVTDDNEGFDLAVLWSDGARSGWRLRCVATPRWLLKPLDLHGMPEADFPSTAAKGAGREP